MTSTSNTSTSNTSATRLSGSKATQFPQDPVLAMPDEQQALSRLESLMLQSQNWSEGANNQAPSPQFVGSDGQSVALPPSLVGLLRQLVHDLAQGRAVMLVSHDQELTTQQAADLLNISRPYLVKMLERGEIPFTKTGTHRRVLLADLMEYKQHRDARRRQGLAQLTQLAEEMGDYN